MTKPIFSATSRLLPVARLCSGSHTAGGRAVPHSGGPHRMLQCSNAWLPRDLCVSAGTSPLELPSVGGGGEHFTLFSYFALWQTQVTVL